LGKGEGRVGPKEDGIGIHHPVRLRNTGDLRLGHLSARRRGVVWKRSADSRTETTVSAVYVPMPQFSRPLSSAIMPHRELDELLEKPAGAVKGLHTGAPRPQLATAGCFVAARLAAAAHQVLR